MLVLKVNIQKKIFLLSALLCVFGALKANPVRPLSFKVAISNHQAFVRNNEVIHISRSAFGRVVGHLVPVVTLKSKALIWQLVDDNKDGIWDDLLIQVSMPARSADTLHITWIKGDEHKPSSPPYTSVRLSLKSKTGQPTAPIATDKRARGFTQNIADPYYQMEGPGIENDKVAFRAFFDYRNGKDIYGKIVDTPVLKQVGVNSTWHTLQNWGMDIWKVGNSTGAGALNVTDNGTLYRLADADTSVFTSLYQGPLKAAFKLSFVNWDVAKGHKNGSETVSMTKGQFFYQDDISVPLTAGQQLAPGMGNFGPYPVKVTKHNATYSSISTYGNQAEGTGSNLGVAILFATKAYAGHHTTTVKDSIPSTSYVQLHWPANGKGGIRFVACWEKTDKRFSTQQGFDTYLQQAADRLAHPIQVKIINN